MLFSLFEHSPDAIAIYDRDLILRRSNPARCQFFGRAEHELIGRHVSAFVEPGSLGETAACLVRANNGECIASETELRNAAGETMPVHSSFFPSVLEEYWFDNSRQVAELRTLLLADFQ